MISFAFIDFGFDNLPDFISCTNNTHSSIVPFTERIKGVNQNTVQILINVLVVIAEMLSNASSMGPP